MEYKGYKGIALQNDTIKKWLYTRKRSHDEFLSIGSFRFPGIYTTQNFKSDLVFFWIALVSELGFLAAVCVLVGGFDILLSLSALVCVILDFIGAFFYHKNENEVCKAQLDLNIERYKIESGQRSVIEEVKIRIAKLNLLKKDFSRRLGISLIIISAILKIAGSAVLFEMPVFTIVLTVIYCFVAWIHIKKTGFYISGKQFFNALEKDLKKHITSDGNAIKNLDRESDFRVMELENIPQEVSQNLKEIRMQIFENSNIYNSLYKKDNRWYYRIWNHQTFDDADLQAFVNSKDLQNDVLSDAAKAFIAVDVSKRMFLSIPD